MQQLATIQSYRLLHPIDALGTIQQLAVGVGGAGGQQPLKACYVELAVAAGPLNRLPRDRQQVVKIHVPGQHFAHARQRLAQIGEGCAVRLIRPHQCREHLAPMRPVRFERQITQQCTRGCERKLYAQLIIFKLERSEQRERKRHGCPLSSKRNCVPPSMRLRSNSRSSCK